MILGDYMFLTRVYAKSGDSAQTEHPDTLLDYNPQNPRGGIALGIFPTPTSENTTPQNSGVKNTPYIYCPKFHRFLHPLEVG